MDEIPAYVVHYLAEAMAFLKDAPETPTTGAGVHFYLSKVAVVCEGEVIGYLDNEDPDWIYRPVKPS